MDIVMPLKNMAVDTNLIDVLHDLLRRAEPVNPPSPVVIDVPGLKSQIEDDNVLVVCGERKREKERDTGVKYLRMGKYLNKFVLPENANVEKVSAVCQDGVLTVTVEKLPPPQPKTIEVKIG